MANWKEGIKLLLSSYDGDRVNLTSKQNDFSDFIQSLNIESEFEFLFKGQEHFAGEAFDDSPGGSTKGTKLHHYFNNFALSPSRANSDLQSEIDSIKASDGSVELPLKNNFVRAKWLYESVHGILKKMSETEFDKYKTRFLKSNIPFVDVFNFEIVEKTEMKSTYTSEADPISIIFYGPPGTGKTRGAIYVAEKFLKENKFPKKSSQIQLGSIQIDSQLTKTPEWYSVQFHPSFSYEDFFEGLRPVQSYIGNKAELTYEIVPGIFKVVAQLARASFEPGKYGIEVTAYAVDGSIEKWLMEEGGTSELYLFSKREGYFEYDKQKIFVTGKEHKKTSDIKVSGENYTGSLKVKWYSNDQSPLNFILFIDELNRGNPAKIFGEALSMLEPTKRLGKGEPSYLNLPYSHEKFIISPNLHILGAMNSADKSLAHLDQAFRRRFKFIYLSPNFELLKNPVFIKNELGDVLDLDFVSMVAKYFELINNALSECNVNTDNHVGHSYAIDLLKKIALFKRNNDSVDIVKVLTTMLVRFWQHDLHALLRDIVGEYKINDFANNYFNLLLKSKDDFPFIQVDEKLRESLVDYLVSADPVEEQAPLKEVA